MPNEAKEEPPILPSSCLKAERKAEPDPERRRSREQGKQCSPWLVNDAESTETRPQMEEQKAALDSF